MVVWAEGKGDDRNALVLWIMDLDRYGTTMEMKHVGEGIGLKKGS